MRRRCFWKLPDDSEVRTRVENFIKFFKSKETYASLNFLLKVKAVNPLADAKLFKSINKYFT